MLSQGNLDSLGIACPGRPALPRITAHKHSVTRLSAHFAGVAGAFCPSFPLYTSLNFERSVSFPLEFLGAATGASALGACSQGIA